MVRRDPFRGPQNNVGCLLVSFWFKSRVPVKTPIHGLSKVPDKMFTPLVKEQGLGQDIYPLV
jgi:hypothetical protein